LIGSLLPITKRLSIMILNRLPITNVDSPISPGSIPITNEIALQAISISQVNFAHWVPMPNSPNAKLTKNQINYVATSMEFKLILVRRPNSPNAEFTKYRINYFPSAEFTTCRVDLYQKVLQQRLSFHKYHSWSKWATQF
jgi:hypothetical protein